MKPNPGPSATRGAVHLVDDDESVRVTLELMLEDAGFDPVSYPDGETFLASLGAASTGCVLLDLRMPRIDGLSVQLRMADLGIRLPVIILTGHGDVDAAVQAMKAGAVDFLQKPCTGAELFAAIEGALRYETPPPPLATLSPREKDVLDGLLAGKRNKIIAWELGLSPRTVEMHRARLMDKMGASSLAELLRLALA